MEQRKAQLWPLRNVSAEQTFQQKSEQGKRESYRSSRHCAHHNRHLDNSRTQVSKKLGLEGLRNFSEKCKDIQFANKQITYMAEKSVGLSMFARAPLIDWTLWQQEFGKLIETKEASQTRSFEEEQWIIRQVTKFGRC